MKHSGMALMLNYQGTETRMVMVILFRHRHPRRRA